MKKQRAEFDAPALIRVAGAELYQSNYESALAQGDIVTLNSGGPRMMVVDIDDSGVTAAWRTFHGDVQEASFPAPCLHRASPV